MFGHLHRSLLSVPVIFLSVLQNQNCIPGKTENNGLDSGTHAHYGVNDFEKFSLNFSNIVEARSLFSSLHRV